MELNQPKILVDFRESRSRVPEFLSKMGIEFEKTDLTVDYVVSKSFFVERKTVTDFISSICDKRIFRQVSSMSYNYSNPLLLLEGGGLYSQRGVVANSIRGIMLWIAVTKKVPVIRTFSEYDTACVLKLLAKRHLFVKNPDQKVLRSRRTISPGKQQINVLRQIPGIGLYVANCLLSRFGSISNILEASNEDLLGIQGMGEKRIKAIRQIFNVPNQKLST